jgi:hypothetical protein
VIKLTKRQIIEKTTKIPQLAIEWERLRSPMRYLVANGRGDEITDVQWAEFTDVECALAEAVWAVTGSPTIPAEGWRSTFKVVDGGKK